MGLQLRQKTFGYQDFTSGDKVFTVRAATPRLMSIQSIREFADLADKYCDGHLRFTSRNNVEFLLTDKSKIPANIAREQQRKDVEARVKSAKAGIAVAEENRLAAVAAKVLSQKSVEAAKASPSF